MQRLRVSGNRRFLCLEDGSPFFWMADTAWELLHKLDADEAHHYLEQRAKLGFNVIQTVALAELDGLRQSNAYGRVPLQRNESGEFDPSLPDTEGTEHYWTHVDRVIGYAASLGLYIALLPTWGDKFHQLHGEGPVVFNERNAEIYGEWLGRRYKDTPNIIWVLGGDRPLATSSHFAIINAMARGLKKGDGGGHLMTFHPQGCQTSSYHLHDEEWLDFNMLQSGHGERRIDNYARVAADYGKAPVKPVLDAEPCYEDIAVGFKPENGYFDAADVRMAAYYAVFAGAFGHTYGHHSVWSMASERSESFLLGWREALDRPGAAQMRHLRRLMESRPFFERVPDQRLVPDNLPGANYMAATRGPGYAMVYLPNGAPANVATGILGRAELRASWYNPRTGELTEQGLVRNEGTLRFTPPTAGRGEDWVLLLDEGTEG